MGKPCEWNGIWYESVTAAANALGLQPETMRQRVKRVLKSDTDMRSNPFEWNGIVYDSLREAALATGKAVSTMRVRKANNYKSDNDVGGNGKHPGGRFYGNPCSWNGVQYPSISAAAKVRKVYPSEMWLWISQGFTSDDEREAVVRASRPRMDNQTLTEISELKGKN